MRGGKKTTSIQDGISELADLLQHASDQPSTVNDGYIDVLGDRDANGSRLGQQMFRKKIFTLIYERYWRPVFIRIFLGLRGPSALEERRLAVGMLELSPGDRVIDVGCGPGNFTRDLASASGSGLVVGIDASEAMVAAAARRGGRVGLTYLRADAHALPFEDGTFDAACSVGVIHMVERPMQALEEIVRVLAPGGRLAIMSTWTRRDKPRRPRGGLKVFARNELTDALRGHGLVDIDQRVIGRGQFVSARKPGTAPIGR